MNKKVHARKIKSDDQKARPNKGASTSGRAIETSGESKSSSSQARRKKKET